MKTPSIRSFFQCALTQQIRMPGKRLAALRLTGRARRAGIEVGLGLFLAAMTAQSWAARPETTTTINVTGAVVTVASGINADGFIVGSTFRQAGEFLGALDPQRLNAFVRAFDDLC